MISHVPVLLEECLKLISPQPGRNYLDGTFGGGGHSTAILSRVLDCKLVAIDCDPEASRRASTLLTTYPKRFQFYAENFRHIDRIPGCFDGVLLDIGVSTFQLDVPSRGFSFRHDAPNDMRMDNRKGQSASEFLELAERSEIERAVRDYGEEPRWYRIVNAIIAARGTGRLARTSSFAELVAEVAPSPVGIRCTHPATRTFQGIRIAINDELGALTEVLPLAFAKLTSGGVLAVISFHSLEDRIVKRFMNGVAGRPIDRNDSRNQDERLKYADLLTRKPIQPTPHEISLNPRSRSARLRAIRRLSL